MSPTKVKTFCRICEALCGLEATVEGGRVVALEPDASHPATRGFACVKGLRQHELYASPDRLTVPLRRNAGGELERASWGEVNREIGGKLRRLIDEHGPESVGLYVGTAAGFGVLHPVFAQGFMTGVGTPNLFSSATQDCSNKFAVARHMYGFPFTQPFPDLQRTECLIVVGANPVVSKWSFLQVPNPPKVLRAIEERRGRVFFVDPRRTESAKTVGEHVFIRPGTDVFFYLAFLNELIAQGGVQRERVERHTRGFDELCQLAAPWTAERTADVTRVPPETLRELVRAYVQADGAALYSSTGVNMGGRGALAFWLQETINCVSGNLDAPGGTLVGHGVIDFAKFGVDTGTLMRTDRSRVGDFPAVNDTYPGGLLADEILTPDSVTSDGKRRSRIRALFVTGGNPLMTMPNSARLREAFAELDLLVVLDIQPSETASVATHVLPCTSPLQRPDIPFIFPLMLGLQLRPYLQATRALIAPDGEQRDEATIYLDIASAAGISIFGSPVAQKILEALRWSSTGAREARRWLRRLTGAGDGGWLRRLTDAGDGGWLRRLTGAGRIESDVGLPQEALLSLLLTITGQGRFAQLAASGVVMREPHRGGDFLGKRVYTDDGKVQLAPAALLERARTLESDFEEERRDARRLKLITRRQVKTHNSWTHNLERFVSGREGDRNFLYMHPDDAAELGLERGELVDVTSATATVRVGLELLPELMPGTVALPHGWGHQAARGMSVASKTRGVNSNLLAADGLAALEPVSGMARLTGFVVDVRRASGALAPTWSGLPESTALGAE